jgi:F-type H+-transporting ATPase subunit gamma
MINTRILRRRIRSVENTAKICKAMEMIATSKMKKAQDQAMAGRPYAEKITEVISHLAYHARVGDAPHPLLQRREVKRISVLLLTTDRGLCGGLNANLNRVINTFISEQILPVHIITVGRKGRIFMIRTGRTIRAEFTGIKDKVSLLDTLPISRVIIDDYTSEACDLAYLTYPRFISTMIQRPTMEVLLPIDPVELPLSQRGEYIYEPGPNVVLNELLPRFVEMQVYHAVLELIASEQSARMAAMKNASRSAREVIEDLTLTLNKARQESITNEICDISGGAEALSG